MTTLRVRQLPPDFEGRPRLQNVETRVIYADITLGEPRDLVYNAFGHNRWGNYVRYNIRGAWHTTSRDGEPSCPLKPTVTFELIDNT